MKVIEGIILYSISDVSKKLDCSDRTISNYIQKGLLKVQTVHKETLISSYNLQLFLNAGEPIPVNVPAANINDTTDINEPLKPAAIQTIKQKETPTKQTEKPIIDPEKIYNQKEAAVILDITITTLRGYLKARTDKGETEPRIKPTKVGKNNCIKGSELIKYKKKQNK